jgi:putative FmdB family regulatory protein
MALYRYRCDACHMESDLSIPMDAPKTPVRCLTPHCQGEMRRVFDATPHRWAKGGTTLRAPGREWDWPDGKPFEPNEFVARNPSTRAAVTKRAHELARTPNRG